MLEWCSTTESKFGRSWRAEQSDNLVLFPAATSQLMAQDEGMEPLRLASLWSRALAGAKAIPVAVEVHLGNGLPQFQIVGS